jgi:tetratricopeptide (TPR) repeat protein
MMISKKLAIGIAAVVVLIGMTLARPPMVHAAGSDDSPKSAPSDPTYSAALKNVESNKFAEAVPLLQQYVAANPKNADAYNYLGYSHRKLGKYDDALGAYEQALAINPEHRGALEYLGELYLKTNRLDLAKKQLDKLDNLCFFPCAEFTQLKSRVAEYKQKKVGG